MVKDALIKKSIKDIQKALPQFISIFVMATVSVSIVVGLDSLWKTIDENAKAMYKTSRLSDLWIGIMSPTEQEMWAINHIEGIEKTEKRLSLNVQTDLQYSPTLRLYTINEETGLDRPVIREGKWVGDGGAILDENFARTHGLKLGDTLSIEVNERWLDVSIQALAFSSEHIFSIKDSTTLMPDARKYGFIVVDEDKIATAYGGQKIYNQVNVKFSQNHDPRTIQERIDTVLGDDLIGIMTQKDNRSIQDVGVRIEQFITLSRVFPFMFFFVTALITLSTMSRLVEDQRNQIGTLKSLGFSKKSIIWHYTSYGVYVGLLGAVLGIYMGPLLIGKVLINQLRNLYVMDSYKMFLYMPNIIMGSILIVFCTGGVAAYSCLKIQGETPASLLRNKPPKKGTHVLLESIPAIWYKMKFSHMLIARNISRNKGRMLMGIFGVMGCSGLILGALTLHNTISGISKTMYEEVYSYDHIAMLDDKTTEKDIYNLHLDGVVQHMQESGIQILAAGGERRMARITILEGDSPLLHLIDMQKRPITVDKDGIILSNKLAETLGVSQGETVKLKIIDDSYQEVVVKDITYLVSNQGIYISKELWESMGEKYKPTSVFIKWHKEDRSFLQSDYVESYEAVENQKASFEQNLKIVYLSVVLLITFGGILAFVVLYNLSILNFFERLRDLATLQVLGFYKKEIRALVLVENLVSAIVGIFAGIPLGKLITDIIIKGFGENLDLISQVSSLNVLIAGGITFIFVIIVNLVVAKKIETIEMLQSLKSVE
ncbi:ABC transporter permease [Cellulosilyticum sp. I15G10I2]|uniref:ABC transporter permease n=1 Tax=Cellulosilyticum sp. I15G10I2 TaxID=1892843 RepID=UPI00085C2B46|nr:ABC transporter permease [Cellulosilyticum sp. I15G10I2]